jgi:hypothetical protein
MCNTLDHAQRFLVNRNLLTEVRPCHDFFAHLIVDASQSIPMERKGLPRHAAPPDYAIGMVLQCTAHLGTRTWLDVCTYRGARTKGDGLIPAFPIPV